MEDQTTYRVVCMRTGWTDRGRAIELHAFSCRKSGRLRWSVRGEGEAQDPSLRGKEDSITKIIGTAKTLRTS